MRKLYFMDSESNFNIPRIDMQALFLWRHDKDIRAGPAYLHFDRMESTTIAFVG